jgi:hypothetical protein
MYQESVMSPLSAITRFASAVAVLALSGCYYPYGYYPYGYNGYYATVPASATQTAVPLTASGEPAPAVDQRGQIPAPPPPSVTTSGSYAVPSAPYTSTQQVYVPAPAPAYPAYYPYPAYPAYYGYPAYWGPSVSIGFAGYWGGGCCWGGHWGGYHGGWGGGWHGHYH